MHDPDVTWQPSLFESDETPGIDESFSSLSRIELDETSWLDHAPGWVSGSDLLFGALVESKDWGQRTRKMYDKVVVEPRLTSGWRAESGDLLDPAILERMRRVLSDRYEVEFDSLD